MVVSELLYFLQNKIEVMDCMISADVYGEAKVDISKKSLFVICSNDLNKRCLKWRDNLKKLNDVQYIIRHHFKASSSSRCTSDISNNSSSISSMSSDDESAHESEANLLPNQRCNFPSHPMATLLKF